MKIGILTYHRSHNYGALLQAIALRYILTQMGHEALFVDYWPQYHAEMYEPFSLRNLRARRGFKSKLSYAGGWLLYWHRRRKRMRVFDEFINLRIRPHSVEYRAGMRFDALVYGSDQIWRKQRRLGGRFDEVYFGNNLLQTDKHVAYAASMGSLRLDDVDKTFLRESLSKFNLLSVREVELQAMLEQTGVKARLVLDPTLLLCRDDWEELLGSKPVIYEPYLLYYIMADRSFDEEEVQRLADEQGLRLVVLDGRPSKQRKDALPTPSPDSFLSLIMHARCVVTSSYHGLVFSLLCNTPVYAAFSAYPGRAESLLSAVGLEHLLLEPLGPLPHEIPTIDFKAVGERLKQLRQGSLDFLQTIG